MNVNMILILLSLLWLCTPESVNVANGQIQTIDTIMAFQGGKSGQCLTLEERARAQNEIRQVAYSVIGTALGTTSPASTTTMPSTITSATTMSTMTSCGGSGWKRVAFINTTDTSYNCPTRLNLTIYSKRTCGRSHTTPDCSSTIFSVGGVPYSQVCGRIRGYQFGATSAFNFIIKALIATMLRV